MSGFKGKVAVVTIGIVCVNTNEEATSTVNGAVPINPPAAIIPAGTRIVVTLRLSLVIICFPFSFGFR